MVDWGAAPDWLAAAAAFAAVVFAAKAALAAQATNEQQTRQLLILEDSERRRDFIERRSQAARFSFWISLVPEEGNAPAVRVSNSNADPIYELTLFCCTPSVVTRTSAAVVGPNTRRIMPRPTENLRQALVGIDQSAAMDRGDFRMVGVFRDSQNQWWLRTVTGDLVSADSRQNAHALCRSHLRSMY